MTAKKEAYYAGVRFAPYDLVREFVVAMVVITGLVVILASALSSPDERPLTLQRVAVETPLIFTQTALSMLDGSDPISTYGPPYNNGTASVQHIGPFSPQQWAGVRIPIDTASLFVVRPLEAGAANDSAVQSALATFKASPSAQQAGWEAAYTTALGKASAVGSTLTVPACGCGPVTEMMAAELGLGQSGAMDGLLLTSGHFYQTDYTKPLLFMQNDTVKNQATKFNLLGSTWGAMNETGNYPGSAWLWLYTLFYQIPPYTTAWAANTDALAIVSVTILTLILMFLPWIPGLNRLPRYIGVYRLIWKDHYREEAARRSSPPPSEPAV